MGGPSFFSSAPPGKLSLAVSTTNTTSLTHTAVCATAHCSLYLFPSYKLHMHNAHGCVVGSLSFNHLAEGRGGGRRNIVLAQEWPQPQCVLVTVVIISTSLNPVTPYIQRPSRAQILQASAAAVVLPEPYLLLSGGPGVGQHHHVKDQNRICMVHLVTQHTAVTRQATAAKSHPFGSNTLHLVPVEHLRSLVVTHLSCGRRLE